MRTETAPGPIKRADRAAVAVLLALGVAFPLLADVWLHSLGVPRNDDFAYRATELAFVRTGHLRIVPWGSMTLVGQVLWSAPFVVLLGVDNSSTVLAMAPVCAAGLVCAYYLARAVLRSPAAFACALLVLTAPGFLMNTGTYMTDVPGFSLQMVCLALGWAALKRQGRARWAFLVAAMAAGCAAFSVRDFGLAAPMAVMVCAFAQDRQHKALKAGLSVLTALCCLAIYVVTRHLGVPATSLALPRSHEVLVLGAMCFTLAFFLSPLLVTAASRAWRSFRWPSVLAAGVTLVAGVKVHSVFQDIFLGNGFDQKGALPIELGPGRPDLFPGPVWDLFNLAAVVAGMLLAALALAVLPSLPRRLAFRGMTTLLSVFTLFAALPVGAYCLLVRVGSFDRYIYPLVLPLSVLLARPWRPARPSARPPTPEPRPPAPSLTPGPIAGWASALAFGALVVSAVLTTLNSDAYDRALWTAGLVAQAKGAAANTVFDGFTWEGQYEDMHWVRLYCAQVSNIVLQTAVEGEPFHLEAVVHWDDLGFAVPERLYIYKLLPSSCQAAKPR